MDQRQKPEQGKKNPGSIHVKFLLDKVALGQVFLRVVGFPLSVSFHRCFITWKNEKKKLIIFITGLHKKPLGCGASGKKTEQMVLQTKKIQILNQKPFI
jgi:hypothetical protein